MKPLMRLWVTVLLAALTLSGCESLGVALGLRARQRYYLIDPNSGSLSVDANGGAGGRAGSGDRGGRGGNGGSGFPNGFSGNSGLDGTDGRPGQPGQAGTITVAVDPAAQPDLSVLRLSNRHGNGSAGPTQQIQVEPVATLW